MREPGAAIPGMRFVLVKAFLRLKVTYLRIPGAGMFGIFAEAEPELETESDCSSSLTLFI